MALGKCYICHGEGELPPNGDQLDWTQCGLCKGTGNLETTVRNLDNRNADLLRQRDELVAACLAAQDTIDRMAQNSQHPGEISHTLDLLANAIAAATKEASHD